MTLEKLTITPYSDQGQLRSDKAIVVLFNPNSYSIAKTVSWTGPPTPGGKSAETERRGNAPILTFGGGAGRQLTLELFFDVTEPTNGQKDVRKETDRIVKLTQIDRALNPPRPPTCEVSWGKATTADFPFTGVVSSLTQRFTLFRDTGEALRATLNVVFLEFLDPKIDLRQTDPELTTRRIKRGDTLSGISAQFYRDPSLWRVIAEANDLDDPRRLEIGKTLTIPKLR